MQRHQVADPSLAMPLIERAAEEALRHFLRQGGLEAAITLMLRLTREDQKRSCGGMWRPAPRRRGMRGGRF